MSYILSWESGHLDEIELVFEKAKDHPTLAAQLEKLEQLALAEARENCGMIKTSSGEALTAAQFDELSDSEKEYVITRLGNAGFGGGSTDIPSATITFTLTPLLPRVQGCTIFSLLNRLEKLDGAINIVMPKATLELRVPLGGKKGLMQWELLIMQLYPWLSIRETNTNQAAVTLESTLEQKPAAQPKAKAEYGSGDLLARMEGKQAFQTVFASACAEIEGIIQNKIDSPFHLKRGDRPLTLEEWRSQSDIAKLNTILGLGNSGVSRGVVLCIDFAKIIPNCIALMLLYGADSGQMPRQQIDAGDDPDKNAFIEALTILHPCCEEWECEIMNRACAHWGRRRRGKDREKILLEAAVRLSRTEKSTGRRIVRCCVFSRKGTAAYGSSPFCCYSVFRYAIVTFSATSEALCRASA